MLVIRNYNPDKDINYDGEIIGDLGDHISLSEIEIYDGSSKLNNLSGSMNSEAFGDWRNYQWSNCFDGIDGQEVWNGLCHTHGSDYTNGPSMLYVNLDNRKFDSIKIFNRLLTPLRIIGAEIYVLQGVDEANEKVWSDTFKLNNNKAEVIPLFTFYPSQPMSPTLQPTLVTEDAIGISLQTILL